MDVDYKEIGRRIALRRHELGLKQTEVCESCALNEKYLSNIEHARSIPSIDVILRICDALQTTPDAILLGTKNPVNERVQEDVISQIKGLDTTQLSLVQSFLQWMINQKLGA